MVRRAPWPHYSAVLHRVDGLTGDLVWKRDGPYTCPTGAASSSNAIPVNPASDIRVEALDSDGEHIVAGFRHSTTYGIRDVTQSANPPDITRSFSVQCYNDSGRVLWSSDVGGDVRDLKIIPGVGVVVVHATSHYISDPLTIQYIPGPAFDAAKAIDPTPYITNLPYYIQPPDYYSYVLYGDEASSNGPLSNVVVTVQKINRHTQWGVLYPYLTEADAEAAAILLVGTGNIVGYDIRSFTVPFSFHLFGTAAGIVPPPYYYYSYATSDIARNFALSNGFGVEGVHWYIVEDAGFLVYEIWLIRESSEEIPISVVGTSGAELQSMISSPLVIAASGLLEWNSRWSANVHVTGTDMSSGLTFTFSNAIAGPTGLRQIMQVPPVIATGGVNSGQYEIYPQYTCNSLANVTMLDIETGSIIWRRDVYSPNSVKAEFRGGIEGAHHVAVTPNGQTIIVHHNAPYDSNHRVTIMSQNGAILNRWYATNSAMSMTIVKKALETNGVFIWYNGKIYDFSGNQLPYPTGRNPSYFFDSDRNLLWCRIPANGSTPAGMAAIDPSTGAVVFGSFPGVGATHGRPLPHDYFVAVGPSIAVAYEFLEHSSSSSSSSGSSSSSSTSDISSTSSKSSSSASSTSSSLSSSSFSSQSQSSPSSSSFSSNSSSLSEVSSSSSSSGTSSSSSSSSTISTTPPDDSSSSSSSFSSLSSTSSSSSGSSTSSSSLSSSFSSLSSLSSNSSSSSSSSSFSSSSSSSSQSSSSVTSSSSASSSSSSSSSAASSQSSSSSSSSSSQSTDSSISSSTSSSGSTPPAPTDRKWSFRDLLNPMSTIVSAAHGSDIIIGSSRNLLTQEVIGSSSGENFEIGRHYSLPW